MKISETENSLDLRHEMVNAQLQSRGIQQPAILDAFAKIPRHLFVSGVSTAQAYTDQPLPIKAGQTISQPYVVALMLIYLDIHPHHTILEIGSGSGYATALMAQLCTYIKGIEVYQELIHDAEGVMKQLEISNVEFHHSSAWEQIDKRAVYDRIILWASPPKIPEHIFENLNEGGVLVAPEGKSNQYVWICTKQDGQIMRERKDPVRFVPLVQGSVHEIDRHR